MAQSKNKEVEAAQAVKIEQTVSKTEKFYNENKKIIWGCLAAVAVIIIGILCYTKFYLNPKKAEAAAQMYTAESLFQNGEYATALSGDGNTLGFADIIDQYGSKAGAAVYFYAGVCELQEGNFESAISYLKKYKGDEPILKARALANIGDAYCGLENYKEAISWFEKAAKTADNMFAAAYLLKAGVCYEELGNNAAALNCYKTIREEYPTSYEAYEIDKYIERIGE